MTALIHGFSDAIADGIANLLGLTREHGLVMALHVVALLAFGWCALFYPWLRGWRDIGRSLRGRADVASGGAVDQALHLRAARNESGKLVAFEAPDGVWLYPRHDARGRPVPGDWEPAEDDEINKALQPKPTVRGAAN